jgi:catechol 2,3-dioxygenase-like lactoylglutathione lyase family enzyme
MTRRSWRRSTGRGAARRANRSAGRADIARPTIAGIAPFLVVADVERSLAFYCGQLGFSETFHEGEPPFFAILARDGAQLFVKSEAGIAPAPNSARHPHLRWDAYVSAPDPDGLAAAFAARGVRFSSALQDTSDGLRGFELSDPDGYVLFFGRPR